ncbi:MAG: protocatechuate 3,4-dioxygenase subunit alpha [Vulcanimicrobiaceae bacterium]|jgi:protocatechuate 3,4-dioxygenase alpha subunit
MPIPTGSQTIGPFFRVELDRPTWSDLTREGASGTAIVIEGTVFDGDGTPVPDAMLELWQADANGHYAHPDDDRPLPADPHFRGFGRVCTDDAGHYAFRTVLPGAAPEADGTTQAPHANLTIFARGLLKRVVTRIYFADQAAANAHDPLLRSVSDERVRRTLIAQPVESADGLIVYRFDVVLQGEGETAFLAV